MFKDERGFFIETYRRQWFPLGREMIQGNRGDRQAQSTWLLFRASYLHIAANERVCKARNTYDA